MLVITPGSRSSSPTVRKRGGARRAISSSLAMNFSRPLPNCPAGVCPTAVARQLVRLSGSVNSAVALPSAFVSSSGNQAAVSLKILRILSPFRPSSAAAATTDSLAAPPR